MLTATTWGEEVAYGIANLSLQVTDVINIWTIGEISEQPIE